MTTYTGVQAHRSGLPWRLDVNGDGDASLTLSVPHGVAVHHVFIEVASGQGGSCVVAVSDSITGEVFATHTGEGTANVYCSTDRTNNAGAALDTGVSVTDPTIGRRNLLVAVSGGAQAQADAIVVVIDTVDTE